MPGVTFALNKVLRREEMITEKKRNIHINIILMCNYFLVTLKFIIFDLIMSKIEKLLEKFKKQSNGFHLG